MNKNMIKILPFFLIMMIFIPHFSWANRAKQSFQNCNSDNTICINIIPTKPFNSSEDSSFTAEIINPKNKLIELKNFSLFMPMNGHGPDHPAPPVKWVKTSEKPIKFLITEADFYMHGDWLVQVDFKLNNGPVTEIISVPVKVAE